MTLEARTMHVAFQVCRAKFHESCSSTGTNVFFLYLAVLYRVIALGEHARALWLTSNNSDISLCLLVPNVYDRWSWLERAQSYAWSLKLAIPVWLWDMRPGDSTDCDFRTNDDSPASNAGRSIDSCDWGGATPRRTFTSTFLPLASSSNDALRVRKCSTDSVDASRG